MTKRTMIALLATLLALLLLAPPAAAAAGPSHIVQPGETLTGIAATYGVSVGALQEANGLASPNLIYAGQALIIPGSPAAAPGPRGGVDYVVQVGDTLSGIAAYYGVSQGALAVANGLVNTNYIWVGEHLSVPGGTPSAPPPSPGTGYYTVRPGDTLSGIATQYGVSQDALAAANGINNPQLLFAGIVLRIPDGSAGSPAPAAPGIGQGKWIDVNLSTETMTAYENGTAVLSTAVSTGVAGHPTVLGTFHIYAKLVADDMRGGQAAESYFLPAVPFVMYFAAGGYAIHGTYWHHNFGHPMSHGCVNLPTPAAAWMFNWAPLGTPVTTHW